MGLLGGVGFEIRTLDGKREKIGKNREKIGTFLNFN